MKHRIVIVCLQRTSTQFFQTKQLIPMGTECSHSLLCYDVDNNTKINSGKCLNIQVVSTRLRRHQIHCVKLI